MIECINRHFDLYTNDEATFSLLYDLHKLQEIVETLKGHCVNLHLRSNSDLHETDMYEELNLLRKIVPQESSALNALNFMF